MTGLSATILGCEGPVLSTDEAAFFRDAAPWGFILFARNIETPEQVIRLTAALRDSVGRDAPILIDQEGGRVQRLRAPLWREWRDPMVEVARAGVDFERALWLRYRLMATELRALGIDTNCAPTADIAGPDTHPFLYSRCFGEDPATVIRAARAVAEGLLAGGVLPVIKHIPGHGRAVVDSHLDLPRVSASVAELAATDFAPFAALRDLPLAMTAHIVYEAIDPDAPATSSPIVMRIIREEIGFDGLAMSDDLSMKALSGSFAERAAAAIAAGCDVNLHCNGKREEMEPVVGASGLLAGKALDRAERALARRLLPDTIDTALLEAEFEALGKEEAHGRA